MNSRQHARTTSQGRKVLPPHARPAKPPVLRRGHSYNNAHAHAHHSTSSHQHAAKSTVSKKVEEPEEDEESGMSSFLQFCATCERQIITPGSSILYCSEACRRKDSSRPSSIPSLSPFTEVNSASYPFDLPSGDIMPQRSPTVLRPLSLALSDDFGSSYLDLPAIESEDPATRYLDRFSFDQASRRSHNNTSYHHRCGRNDSSALPSLVHSPSSSYGTVESRSMSYEISSSTTSTHHHQPATSPGTKLLKDPSSSLKSSASTLTSFRTVEAVGGMSWRREKRRDSRHDDSREDREKEEEEEEVDGAVKEVEVEDFAPRTWTRWVGGRE